MGHRFESRLFRLVPRWLRTAPLVFLAAPPATSQTVALPPVGDTYLKSGSPNRNQGGEPILRVQSTGRNRALVRFDPLAIEAAVGDGSLAAARLELFIQANADNWGSSGRTVDAHALAAEWSEEGATWNCGIDAVPGNGQAECTAWAGGQFAEEPSDSVLHTNGLGGWVSFDVGADVREQLAGSAHHGWLIKKTDEGQNGLVDYVSREGGGGQARLVLVVESAAFDEVPPSLAVTAPAGGIVVNDAAPEIRLEYSDGGSGISAASLEVRVDTIEITSTCAAGAAAATCESPPLAAGRHTVSATLADAAGNSAQATLDFELFVGAGLHQASFDAVADTYLRQGSPNQNQGDESLLRIRQSGRNRGLVAFDGAAVAAALAGATLRSAHLELAIAGNGDNWGPSGRLVDAHRLNAPWAELAATWNCAIDADTSNQQADCSPQWSGGAVAPAPSASVLHANGQRGTVRFDVTADLAAELGGEPHFGWLLKKRDESRSGLVEYRAREDAAGLPPRLVVLFEIAETGEEELPPDPATIAPALTLESAVDLFAASSFLWESSTPVQTGAVPGAVLADRIGLVRGRVLGANGLPLAGVRVVVHGAPELGQTLSRQDGLFDLAVNGGGRVVLRYDKDGYLDAFRALEVPARDWAEIDDVVLVALDPEVSEIAMGMTEMQVARGSLVTDEDGSRRATLLFPGGITATMRLPGGGSRPLSALHARATEYSVGELGPQRMPADLPENTTYNYAVELSVDEALDAGATRVDFSSPVIVYVEDFVGFGAGINVPSGSFDRERAVWVPEPDGRVVEVLGVDSGMAELDVEGNGEPASAEELETLGVSTAERVRLAALYAPGSVLWRVPVGHFSTWDWNYAWGVPPDATAPPTPEPVPTPATTPPGDNLPPGGDGAEPPAQDPPCENGSILDCGNRVLRELVHLAGTPFRLFWASDRGKGLPATATLRVQLTDEELPATLSRVTLLVSAGGWSTHQSYEPEPNLVATVVWPQVDRWLREMPFDAPVLTRVCYAYRAQNYASSRREFYASFSRIQSQGNTLIRPSRARSDVSICRQSSTEVGRLVRPSLGGWDATTAALGGWTLDVHHRFNPLTGTLFLGDGRRRLIRPLDTAVHRFAGNGSSGDSGDGGRARDAEISFPSDIAFARDGSVLIADSGSGKVRRVSPTGTITTFAGNGETCEEIGCGDGGMATDAPLGEPLSVALDLDGTVLIGDADGCIRRVDREGRISTLAGDCFQGPSLIGWPADLLVGPGGGIYVSDEGWNQIRYLGTDGVVTPLAGDTSCRSTVGGVPALDTAICSPGGLAFDADGLVLVAGGYSERILRIRRDGILEIVAGDGRISGPLGDGGPATSARFDAPFGIAARADGSYLVADTFHGRVRRVSPHGLIESLTPGTEGEPLVDGMPPERLFIGFAEKVAIAPDNRIFVADSWDPQVLVIGEVAPLRRDAEYLIPSPDGSEVYVFDELGLHLRTAHALTGADLLTFGYDGLRRLVSVTDLDGNVTRILRDQDGFPLAIVGPFGQRSELALDFAGYLESVTNPAGESTSFFYGTRGELLSMTDARGGTTEFVYDEAGKLEREIDRAGGFKNLLGAANGEGEQRVTVQTALGRTTAYERRLDSENEVRWTRRAIGLSDVVTTRTVRERGGASETLRPDGTRVTTTVLSDPAWGPLVRAPDAAELRTPVAGLGPTTAVTRIADLANFQDPLSLTSRTTEVRVNGRLYRSAFDRESLTWTFTTPAGRTSTLEIDEAGRPVASQIGDLEPVSYSYDGNGRLLAIAQGSGGALREVGFAYDGAGRLATVTDPLQRQVSFDYDAADRVTEQTLPGGRSVLFEWDANGNLSALSPPGRPAHFFDSTPVDLPALYEPPDVGGGDPSTEYFWNFDRNPEKVVRPGGESIAFEYDAGQRPVAITSRRGTQSIVWQPNTGRVASLTTPEGVSLVYTYDGPLVTRTQWSGGGISGQVNRTYDDDLRLRTVAVNGASSVTYGYDADSLLTHAGSLALARDTETGLLTGTTLGLVTTSYTYDGFGELSSMTARHGATTLYSEVYTRDRLGRIVARVETLQGVTTTFGYSYDAAGRLETVETNGLVTAEYVYDANGNRLEKRALTGTELGRYDDQDRMLTYGDASFAYTANGELLTRTDPAGTTRYDYDVFGNLLGVDLPNGTQIDYKVDGRNRRIERRVNGAVTQRLLWQGQLSPIAELNASNTVVSRFVYATRVNVPDYLVKAGVTYRVLTDYLGSPRLIVNASTGAIVQRMSFDEWGVVTQDTNPGFQPFGFAGGVYEKQTGLTRLGMRDLDTLRGRWTTKDAIRFGGGDSGLFTYLNNAPVDAVDPTGLAQSCTRDLAFPGKIASALYPGGSESLDQRNQEPLHRQYWFDNGANLGFFKGSQVRPDYGHSRDEYVCDGSKFFEENLLRQAIENIESEKGGYELLGRDQNNCQDWAEKVRSEYERLRMRETQRTGRDPELEYIFGLVLDDLGD